MRYSYNELAAMPEKPKPPTRMRQESGPEIRVGPNEPPGPATLHEIEEELARVPWPRPPLSTVSFEETHAPSKPQAARKVRPIVTSAPEIELRLAPAGQDTLAAIDADADALSQQTSKCDALELRTFVVPSAALDPKATDAEKRAFVRDRLAHRLPCAPTSVRRIDLKVLEPGAVLVRVWCPVD